MACYISQPDGSLEATRTGHLSDEVKAPIVAEVDRAYQSQVAARLEREEEERARVSEFQEAEEARLSRLGLSLRTRAEELGSRELGLATTELELTTFAGDLDRQRTRQEQRDAELGEKGADLFLKQTGLAGLASELEDQERQQKRRERELGQKDMDLFTKDLQIAEETSRLRQKERRQEERDRELGSKEADLIFKELEVTTQAGEVKQEKTKLEKTARGLDRRANRLSAKERGLEKRKRREEAEQRGRRQEAEVAVAALDAGVEAAGGKVMVRWREADHRRVKAAVTEAKRLLSAGDLPKVHLTLERATIDLEEIEKCAFEDQRCEGKRKQSAGIVVAALRQVGFMRVGAKTRNPADPRSVVNIAGAMPSGKTVIFTLHHDGRIDIRQRGVSGHQECHSIEDAIAAAAGGMGLEFRGGRKVTVRGRRPAGRGVKATARARSKVSKRGA